MDQIDFQHFWFLRCLLSENDATVRYDRFPRRHLSRMFPPTVCEESRMKMSVSMRVGLPVIALACILAGSPVLAQEDLAKQSQNPVSDLVSVPFENNFFFDLGPLESDAFILNIKPVYPTKIGDNFNLINRVVLPVVYLEGQSVTLPGDVDLGTASGLTLSRDSEFGLGDTTYQGFFSPAVPGKLIWGIGPAFVLPTHTDDNLGTEKWSGGISLLGLSMPGRWVIGVLAQNVWSFAGDDDAADVNSFLLQPIINYNLAGGWYLTSTPVITANWESDSDNRWTVPAGGGVGRLMQFGERPVDLKLAAYYNAEKPRFGPDWSLQFTVKLLFPKK